MFMKIATYMLVGSVATLAIARVVGVNEHHWRDYGAHKRYAVRIDREVAREVHAEIAEARQDAHEAAREARLEAAEARREAQEEMREARRSAHNAGGLLGTYRFDAKGNPLGKMPWAANVELELRDGGEYELRVKTEIDGTTETDVSWGTYRVRGDRLVLSAPHDSDRTEFIIDGGELRLEADWTERLALKAVGVDHASMVKVQTKN